MTSEPSDRAQDDQGEDSSHTEPEGTIPNTEDGVGVTTTEEPSSFEPEEDTGKDAEGEGS